MKYRVDVVSGNDSYSKTFDGENAEREAYAYAIEVSLVDDLQVSVSVEEVRDDDL